MKFKVGDRIKLICMHDDPAPIGPGSRGTVTFADVFHFGVRQEQYGVDWDGGRTLAIVCPPDEVVRIEKRRTANNESEVDNAG